MDAAAQPIYRETRFGVEPSSAWQVINVSVPSPGRSHRTKQQQAAAAAAHSVSGGAIAQDEATFRRRNLATASAVYYRSGGSSSKHSGPRSFLWRVLDDGAVLSIRAADVHRGRRGHGGGSGDSSNSDSNGLHLAAAAAPPDDDAPHVLNLHFDSPVFPSCVALADSPDHDALHVFALDQALRLHAFALRIDYFRKRASVEGGLPAEAHKVHHPAEFSSHLPHRLYAVSPDLLMVALQDGSLVKLERTRPGDGELFFLCRVLVVKGGGGKTPADMAIQPPESSGASRRSTRAGGARASAASFSPTRAASSTASTRSTTRRRRRPQPRCSASTASSFS
jgi:nuclear pore complex protein Nup160